MRIYSPKADGCLSVMVRPTGDVLALFVSCDDNGKALKIIAIARIGKVSYRISCLTNGS